MSGLDRSGLSDRILPSGVFPLPFCFALVNGLNPALPGLDA
jgi:hypothetical protein